ncbi:9007_t:CDS:2, partial [Racocetra persica]
QQQLIHLANMTHTQSVINQQSCLPIQSHIINGPITNQLTNMELKPRYITTLISALQQNPTIYSLDLTYLLHNEIEFKNLVQMLTTLNLSFCTLGSNIATQKIADSLHKNHILKHLALHNSFITYSSGNTILNALCENSSLIHLNLSTNKLNDQNCATLAKMLRKNTTLISLDLNYNQLGRNRSFVANSLGKNKSLEFLGLCQNSFSPTIVESFLENRNLNTTLIQLDLSRILDDNQIVKIKKEEKYLPILTQILFKDYSL